jgi:hypothetical protein
MSEGRSVEQWLSLAANVAAPAGVVTALLFYFGYASTRAKYAYFGVDVDAVGLGTRDFLLRSPQPLFVPLVVLAVLALIGVWLHIALRAGVEVHPNEHPARARRRRAFLRAAGSVEGVGAAALVAGVTLILFGGWLTGWTAYDMVTPLCLMFGVLLLTYSRHIRAGVSDRKAGHDGTNSATLRRMVWILCATVVAGSAFWAASTLAEWSGRGQAINLSSRFGDLPRVILDTKERLYVQNEVIKETSLPPVDGQAFRYRYRNLRLLVNGGGRMFLVPETWSNNGTTLVVPLDGGVRVQFQFQNPG